MVDSNTCKPEVIEAIQVLIKNNVLEDATDSIRLPRFMYNLAKARGPQFTPEDLRKLWNARKHPSQYTAVKLNDKRTTAARARIKQYPAMSRWVWLIDKIKNSAWCRGEQNANKKYAHWKASFDYLIKTGTMIAALEGRLDWQRPQETEPQDRVESRRGMSDG